MMKPEAILAIISDLYTQVAELQRENAVLRMELQRLEAPDPE